jgi:hypothetical protein
MEGIPLKKCKNRFLYRIHSRNLEFGVFNESLSGFTGIREKARDLFLFTEYHRDTGSDCGTVNPLEELEPMPEGMRLEAHSESIDKKTRRPVGFDKPVIYGGRGWYYTDTNEASNKIRPVSFQNDELFDWLKEKEKQYKSQ